MNRPALTLIPGVSKTRLKAAGENPKYSEKEQLNKYETFRIALVQSVFSAEIAAEKAAATLPGDWPEIEPYLQRLKAAIDKLETA